MAQKDPLLMTCEGTRLSDGEAITLFLRTKQTIEVTSALVQDGSGWEGISWGKTSISGAQALIPFCKGLQHIS